MCGIAGYIGENASVNLVAMLQKLEYRGYDSAGVAVVSNGGSLDVRKGVGYLSDVVSRHQIKDMEGEVGIGHVRWATHGRVCAENAHPFTDCHGRVAIVHNGIIENYEELRQELLGHSITSETDSELIAHLVEHYLDDGKNAEDAFMRTILRLRGSYAIAVLFSWLSDRILVARQGSPLVAGWSSSQDAYVASDYLALPDCVERIMDIPEQAMVTIQRRILPEAKTKPETIYAIESCDQAHYMLKEIMEQPKTFKAALQQDKEVVQAIAMDILRARDVVFTACGSSRFAAFIGRYLFSTLAGRMSDVIVGSEFQYFADSLTAGSLVIALSQSGETADVIAGVEALKGVRIISVINRQMSRLEAISDRTLHMNAGPEVSVAATKTFTSELAIMYLLALTISGKSTDVLDCVPDAIGKCLANQSKIADVSTKIAKAEHLYYVARGLDFAVAGECALKLKEISYIHAESMAAGELKHGTLSLIEKGTPVVGICPDNEMYQDMTSSLMEAKSRGAHVIGISDRASTVFDDLLEIPRVDKLCYPVLVAVVGQLLAYYATVARGLNPDRPRNLAKSVTVR